MPRILIIDDDPAVSWTFARMLEWQGYAVRRTESAEAGLAALFADPPDALLLDMRMPLMSGLDVLREVRRSASLRALPVAVVTGDYFLKDGVLGELAALGATVRYKPLGLEELAALAAELTGGAPVRPGPNAT